LRTPLRGGSGFGLLRPRTCGGVRAGRVDTRPTTTEKPECHTSAIKCRTGWRQDRYRKGSIRRRDHPSHYVRST